MDNTVTAKTAHNDYSRSSIPVPLAPDLHNRVLSKAQWTEIKRMHTDLSLVRKDFDAAVAENLKQLQTRTDSEKQRAYQTGLNQATDTLLKSAISLHRTAQDQQTELINLMFAAVEKVLGEAASNIITARLARAALNQQVDAHTVIGLTVHPDAVDQVAAQLDAWRSDTGGPKLELHADVDMTPTDCDIETRYGTVRAGLVGQLDVLRRSLLQVKTP